MMLICEICSNKMIIKLYNQKLMMMLKMLDRTLYCCSW